MAKFFTITEGLENMGAIKTGGQGSVYKGRRMGEIITAIKILPTPIFSESADDKNYVSFQNEVHKLKKVNEDANPNVVKMIGSGITESGNFPFIEMEYIEGPDVEELLKPPHAPLFTIKEVLKVAEQLSCALAHCHKADVRHGDIKSNNVKFNINTGNYVLLDFGLAAMSDEQRRTSLRRAGAIEFMAPEQNEGKMLLQTDVYSFGVILFELLAGVVPFPLNNSGETGRNKVMIAHMEKPPPDVLQIREENFPLNWTKEKRHHEMQVPGWLVSMLYKCLEKRPENRFANGVELHEYIWQNAIQSASEHIVLNNDRILLLEDENKRLKIEAEQLQQQLWQLRQSDNEGNRNNVLNNSATQSGGISNKSNPAVITKSSPVFLKGFLLFLFVAIAIVASVYFLTNTNKEVAKPVVVKRKVPAVTATIAEPADVRNGLQTAKQFLTGGKTVEAFAIYSTLAQKQVPEAMYFYGKMALQNKNLNISCADGFDLLKRASDKGYTPAKRTLGFLYAFAADKAVLEQSNYFARCTFSPNISKGSQLLMEATLQGDTAASRLLNVLNAKH